MSWTTSAYLMNYIVQVYIWRMNFVKSAIRWRKRLSVHALTQETALSAASLGFFVHFSIKWSLVFNSGFRSWGIFDRLYRASSLCPNLYVTLRWLEWSATCNFPTKSREFLHLKVILALVNIWGIMGVCTFSSTKFCDQFLVNYLKKRGQNTR